jgi:hypothetical protein
MPSRRSLIGAAVLALCAGHAMAVAPFVVKDIRVEGIQRTEAGTVFSYLPVRVGETFDDDKGTAAIKALYATGFFKDVRLEEESGVLVVLVEERPAISSVDFTGTKEFEKDMLVKALKEIGVGETKIFDKASVDRAEQELKRQYLSHGLYGVKITTTVTPIERNRVTIMFNVDEGDVAKIKGINIVGNKAFSDKQLREILQLNTSRLVHLVLEGRPVLEAEADRRPRKHQVLVPEPRLPRSDRRVDPGVDHPGQEGHLPHHQHHRRREVHRLRRQDGRRDLRPRRGTAQLVLLRRARPIRANCWKPRTSASPSAWRASATPSPTSPPTRNRTAKSAKWRSPSSSIRASAPTCAT